MPPPPTSQRSRCSGVALLRRGNQINGTLMMRPSVSATCIIASPNETDLARAETGRYDRTLPILLAELVMPRLQELDAGCSEELAELVVRQANVAHEVTHRDRVHRVMPRNAHYPRP